MLWLESRTTWAETFLTTPVILSLTCERVWSLPSNPLPTKNTDDEIPANALDVAIPRRLVPTLTANRSTLARSNILFREEVADALIVPPTETRLNWSPVLNLCPGR